MNIGRLNWLGLALLLGTFLFAALRVISYSRQSNDPDRPVLRFAHWQLEGGVRDAFDEVAREYMRLHPHVRVEQLAIPDRAYPSWLRTQLVGGTAPDLIAVGMGVTDELLARFFTPLTEHVEQPNPYNQGTPLEGLPWRSTFVDELTGSAFNVNLLEYYSIPSTLFTVRVFYNRDLWRSALGDTPHPADYRAFLAICARVEEWARERNRPISAISGSRYNAPFLMAQLFRGQTQRLALDVDMLRTMNASPSELGVAFLRGEFDLEDDAIRSGLTLMREVGHHMQPGFLQLGRDDAMFRFAQGTTLMMATGSWDATSLRQQVPFELGVFSLPSPAADDAEFGRFVLGPASEGNIRTASGFGLTRQSQNPELALDFLHFLASRPGNRLFTGRSGWLPAIVGVEPDAFMAPFVPRIEGVPDGFDLTLRSLGPDLERARDNHLHHLFSPSGGVDEFLRRFAPAARSAIRDGLRMRSRNAGRNVMRQDVQLAAFHRLGALRPDEQAQHASRFAALLEGQNSQEADLIWIEQELGRLASPP